MADEAIEVQRKKDEKEKKAAEKAAAKAACGEAAEDDSSVTTKRGRVAQSFLRRRNVEARRKLWGWSWRKEKL